MRRLRTTEVVQSDRVGTWGLSAVSHPRRPRGWPAFRGSRALDCRLVGARASRRATSAHGAGHTPHSYVSASSSAIESSNQRAQISSGETRRPREPVGTSSFLDGRFLSCSEGQRPAHPHLGAHRQLSWQLWLGDTPLGFWLKVTCSMAPSTPLGSGDRVQGATVSSGRKSKATLAAAGGGHSLPQTGDRGGLLRVLLGFPDPVLGHPLQGLRPCLRIPETGCALNTHATSWGRPLPVLITRSWHGLSPTSASSQ